MYPVQSRSDPCLVFCSEGPMSSLLRRRITNESRSSLGPTLVIVKFYTGCSLVPPRKFARLLLGWWSDSELPHIAVRSPQSSVGGFCWVNGVVGIRPTPCSFWPKQGKITFMGGVYKCGWSQVGRVRLLAVTKKHIHRPTLYLLTRVVEISRRQLQRFCNATERVSQRACRLDPVGRKARNLDQECCVGEDAGLPFSDPGSGRVRVDFVETIVHGSLPYMYYAINMPIALRRYLAFEMDG